MEPKLEKTFDNEPGKRGEIDNLAKLLDKALLNDRHNYWKNITNGLKLDKNSDKKPARGR